ncbi:MAG: murein hydrolase activator EnvC family protein [Cellulomonas sp.]
MAPALGTIVGIGVVVGALAMVSVSGAPATDPTTGAASSAHAVHGSWGLPLAGDPVVARPFDAPPAPWAPGHRGVDLAATPGQLVLAPTDGVVAFAGTVVDRGVVTIVDSEGLRTSLEPVTWSVGAGTRVHRGDPVGTIQAVSGHCAPASCLHWGVRRGETYLDPLALVHAVGRVILLPER